MDFGLKGLELRMLVRHINRFFQLQIPLPWQQWIGTIYPLRHVGIQYLLYFFSSIIFVLLTILEF